MDAKPHEPTFESLLAHADWVRGLARSLVRDAAEADDLVQEAWLAALRRGPAPNAPPRAWLAAVVRNALLQRVRGERRRAERERAAARDESLPPDDDLDERVALQRWLIDEVQALEEPYRRTLLLRHFDGLPPRRIAQRMGVPVETVKSRLQRGLMKLRSRLDAGSGPGRASGALALLPLAVAEPWRAFGALALGGAMKMSMAFAAAVLLLAFGLYVGFGTGGDLEVERGEPEALGGREREVASPQGVAQTTAEPRAPALESSEREAVVTDAGELLVTVVEGEAKRPVAGAQVWVVDYNLYLNSVAVADGRGASVDPEVLAVEHGKKFVANVAGEARLPVPAKTTFFVVRSGELYGQSAIAGSVIEPLEIVVRPDRSLTLRAVDVQGKPLVGVPLAIVTTREQDSERVEWWARTSGAHGSTTIHHVQERLKRELDPTIRWSVELAVPTTEGPSAALNPARLPEEPITLTVAAGGRVVVQLLDQDGNPPPETYVHLTWEPVERRAKRPLRHSRWTEGGRAVFDFIEPRLPLRADTSMRGYPFIEELLQAPATGEERILELRIGPRLPSVTGVVTDSDGALVQNRPIEAWLEFPGGDESDVSSGRADAQGRFEVFARTERPLTELTAVHLRTEGGDGGPALSTVVRPTVSPERQVLDLGMVALHPVASVLSGRVVDDRGEPIYWAGVSVMRMAEEGAVGVPPYTWVSPWQTQTSQDGSFHLIGDQGHGEYRLLVGKQGHIDSGPLPFQPGQANLDVVLTRVGALRGRLVLPEGVPGNWLRVRAMDASGAQIGETTPHADGDFTIAELPPGVYSVAVVVPAWRAPLVRVEGMQVESAAANEPVGLAEIDLTEAMHRIDLRLVGPDDEPAPTGVVTIEGERAAQARFGFREGATSLLTRSAAVTLDVVARGYRQQRFEDVRSGATLRMERGVPVTVRLPGDFELPAAPWELALSLRAVEAGEEGEALVIHGTEGEPHPGWFGEPPSAARAQFGSGRERTLYVAHPGTWRVQWWLISDNSTRGLSGDPAYPYDLEVGELPLEVELAPTLP